MPQIRFSPIQNNDGSVHIEDTLTNWSRGLEYMFGHIGEDNLVAETMHTPYAVATGAANTYAVTINPAPGAYTEGLAVAAKINVDNTGASTINVNGLGAKSIKKPNGNDVSAGNLKTGSIYSLRYNGVNFILQGSDAAGNAISAEVLSGKTFSNDSGDQTGTMPNRGTVNITPGTANQAITSGYHSGSGVVYGDADLVAGNIKKDVNIFGAVGTLLSGAVLSGVQSGTYSLPTESITIFNITIASVDLSKSVVFASWTSGGGGKWGLRVYLSDANNLVIERLAGTWSATGRVDWFVLSFSEGISIQRGIVDSPGNVNNYTVTINAVTLSKSLALGYCLHPDDDGSTVYFVNSTSITLARVNATTGWKIAWQVVSFL